MTRKNVDMDSLSKILLWIIALPIGILLAISDIAKKQK